MAVCRGQCSGGQRQGTGRQRGDDLGCDRHHRWRWRLGRGRGRGHHRPDLVVAQVETLVDEVVRGFWWLRGERLRWVSQRAHGRRVRRETKGGDGAGGGAGGGGSGHVGTRARIGRRETR